MAIETAYRSRGSDFQWGAILAGGFVALGVWVLLYTLGAAIGGAATHGPTTWTAIYTLVAPIIALFIGGLIAGRGDRVKSRGDAALYGVVVWGFCALLGSLSIGAVAGLVATQQRGLPSGFTWAIFGSLLLSLIGAVLGAMTSFKGEERPVGTTARRTEVYP